MFQRRVRGDLGHRPTVIISTGLWRTVVRLFWVAVLQTILSSEAATSVPAVVPRMGSSTWVPGRWQAE